MKKKSRKLSLFFIVIFLFAACDDKKSNPANNNNSEFTFMTGDTADCEFDVLTFRMDDGQSIEVSINGLPVEELPGVNKLSLEEFEVITRRGVRFSAIFERAGIQAEDTVPVNCIARDGYDILRTRLSEDTQRLPTFAFMRDHAYVYVGGAGDKDPLFPEMEGKSLLVDYDLTEDAQVPPSMGGTILGMHQYRFKMVEKVSDSARGVFEINPVVK